MRGALAVLMSVCLVVDVARADGPTALTLQGQLATAPNPGGKLSPFTGDASGATVIPTGALTSRPLAARASEDLDVKDYGAACDGVADDTKALQAAQMAGQGRRSAKILVPPGCTMKLSSSVYTVSTNAWSWGAGSSVTGAGVQGLLDQTVNNMQSWSKSSAISANENGLAIYDLFNPTTGSSAYQKNGLYVRTFQVDPSNYTDPQTIQTSRDAVGIESQANITQLNPSGRAWAYHGACGVDPGSEGQCIVGEFESYNNGGYEPLGGRFDSKIGLHVTAMGTQDSTVGVAIAGTRKWETELQMLQQSLRPDGLAWQLAAPDGSSVASMSYDGTIATSGRLINGSGQEVAPQHPGIAAGRFYYGFRPQGFGSPVSTLSTRTLWAPFRNPQQTTYSRIGINVATAGPTGATCTMNIYKAVNGIPAGSPLLVSSPVVAAAQQGDAEATISQTLAAGVYFAGVSCSSDSVALTTYVEGDAQALSGGTTSNGRDTTLSSPFSNGFQSTPSISYFVNMDMMPQIWLRA